jgi:hypothetical protein
MIIENALVLNQSRSGGVDMIRHTKKNGDISNWMTCSMILFGAFAVAAVLFAV